jgi:predicted dehydrogenase
MRIGVIGCGYWGPNLVRNLVESAACEEVACCDLRPDRVAALARRYPTLRTSTDPAAFLRDPSLDAVMIATPLATHHALAKAALLAGKHVFVEKPFTERRAEAVELIRMARRRRRVLMVGHTFLYSPPVRKIKSILDAGDLGRVYYVSSTRVNLGLHRKDVSVVWDLAPHDLSMLIYWLDELPGALSATGGAFVQAGIPDVAFINLRFPSGTLANVHVSWLSPSKLRQTTIVGSKRMLVYDDTANLEQVKVYDKGVDYRDPATFGEYHLSYRAGDVVSPWIETAEPLAVEIAEFVRCVGNGERPPSDGILGLRIVEVLEAVERSMSNSGRPERLGRSSSLRVDGETSVVQ